MKTELKGSIELHFIKQKISVVIYSISLLLILKPSPQTLFSFLLERNLISQLFLIQKISPLLKEESWRFLTEYFLCCFKYSYI